MEYNKEKRQTAEQFANAINAIEGVPISDYAKHLSHLWVESEITGEQRKELLLAYHKKFAEQ